MTQHASTPPHRGLMILIWVALAAAVSAAGYLLRSFMLKTYGVDAFDSVCNVSETINCDKINTSIWGKIAGYPVTLFALSTYSAWAALAWLGSTADDRARACLRLLQVSAGLAVGYGLFLLYIMVAVEKTLCLFCLTMDLASVVVLVSATLSLKRLGPAEGQLYWGRPLATAVVVGCLSLAMTYTWHNDTKDSLIETQKAQAAKIQKDAEAARAKLAKEQAEAKAKAAKEGNAAAPALQEARKVSDSLYVVPVHPEDASIGPADAKVTVVEYADFQCGYCKKLFYALQTIKQRYKGKVRFAFKHFPMSTRCNPHLKNNKHRYACGAALAAECARRQGKFWPMHDLLFKNQHKLKGSDLRWYAQQVGLDMAKYAQCMRAPEPRAALKRSIDEGGLKLGLRATPRTFINGLLLSGSLPPEVLSQFIDTELRKAGANTPAPAAAPKKEPEVAKAPRKEAGMVKIQTGRGAFWIDAYEAAIDAQGRAVSRAGVKPANVSWYDAKKACEKAGKRLCDSYEWVSTCQGKDAVDDDQNGNFADDYIEGNQFPYADFYEPNRCHVTGDRRNGEPVATGSKAECRTPTAVYDLVGNVEEWIEKVEGRAQLAGGDFRVKEKGSCLRAHRSFGPGHRSRGIGFRCCADAEVAARDGAVSDKAALAAGVLGKSVKAFEVDLIGPGAPAGQKFSATKLKGKVTFVSFFASWCSPCSREMPELATLVEEYGKRGFQVLAVGVDTEKHLSDGFAQQHGRALPGLFFAGDPNAKLLGQFDVTNMPTGYLVDRSGKIRHKQIGFGKTTVEQLKAALNKLL